MRNRGYAADDIGAGDHEVFFKKPMFNFEMHRRLVSPSRSCYAHFVEPWKLAIRDEEDPFGYHFSDEDEYLYTIVHAFKHFDKSGCGVRILADIYAFLRKKGAYLDWAYINQALEDAPLRDFEAGVRGLAADGIGEGRGLSDEQFELLCYMTGSGTFGRTDQFMANTLAKLTADEDANARFTKLRYLKKRFLGDSTFIKENHPVFYKHKVLLPLYPIYRAARALTRNPGRTFKEVRLLMRSNGRQGE